MRKIKFIIVALLFSLSTAYSMTIQIFTVLNKPIVTADIPNNLHHQYFNLDHMHQLLNQINYKIANSDPTDAKVIATNLMKQKQKEIAHAVQGIKLAQIYHITKVPTIVFDHGQYEIIGQSNLLKAIQEYRLWLKK